MRPVSGLNKDSDERSQPEGTYRDALNATLDEELGVLRREKGLEQVGVFEDASSNSEIVKGHVILDSSTQGNSRTGNVILFLYNNTTGESRIVEWDVPNQTRTEHIADGGTQDGGNIDGTLDFDESIQAVYRRLDTGDVVLYWTDGVRPPRFVNINNPIPTNVQDLDIFGKINSRLDFNLNDVKNFGGNLKGGTYQLAFAYVDQDGSVTNYFHVSNPIAINSREGFGVESDQATSKSIEFTLRNVDTSYSFLRVAAIKGTQVEVLPDISITDNEFTYTFTGNENSKIGSLDEILIDEASYETAGAIQDHEGTLYMADLTKRDQVDFQKHANDITLEAVTKPITDIISTDEPLKGFTDSRMSTVGTYKRGEAYAFYISYLLKDGSETPAFHIPGPGITSGAAPDDPFKSEIIANLDLPNPSDAAAEGNYTAPTITDDGRKAAHVAIEIDSEAQISGTFNVVYSDPNGNVLSNVSVSVPQGASKNDIVNEIVDALNNNNTFWADFSAAPYLSDEVRIEAQAIGNSWNDYDVEISGSAPFSFTNASGGTEGGRDSQTDPTHTIDVEWETGSTSVDVTTLSSSMASDNVATEYKNALNNDSTFSSNFTASTSGTDVVTITADQNGSDFNADITVTSTEGGEIGSTFLEGGFSSGDELDLEVRVYNGGSWIDISGLTPGMAKNDVASQIQSELDANGPSGFSYTVTDNIVTIEDTNDRNLDDQSPDLKSSFDLGVTVSSYTTAGSDANKANATMTLTGPSPSPSGSASEASLSLPDTPSNTATTAEGTLLDIDAPANATANFDLKFLDDSGNVVFSSSVSVADGASATTIASNIRDKFNQPGNADFEARLGAIQTNVVVVESDNTGSQWNGYEIELDNFSVASPFAYTTPEKTSGGTDSGGDYGDYNIFVGWDFENNVAQEVVDFQTTISADNTPTETATEVKNALNNNTKFSNNYTATSSGDTVTITADTNNSKFNGTFSIEDIPQDLVLGWDNIDGGFDGSSDIEITVLPFFGSVSTDLTVAPGINKEDLALEIYKALINNDVYTGNLNFELNVDTITFIDQTETSSVNGKSPSLQTPEEISFSWSVTEYSGGGGASGSGSVQNQRSEIGSGHPLASLKDEIAGKIKKFHVDSTKFQDGFSFWEQQGETYPDEERWDIVDANGNQVGSIRDRPLRHHKFPEISEERHLSEDINDPSNPTEIYLFGIKAKDVHVPDSIEDEVVGYKIYYAKKDPDERLILDQSLGIRGWLDDGTQRKAQQKDNIFGDDLWCTWGWPPFTDFDNDDDGISHDVDNNLFQFHPFESMRKGIGVQGVTHIKIVGFCGVGISDRKWNSFTPHSEIRNAKGVSYIDQNQRDVDLERFGFSHNFDNLLGESKIIVETDTDINRGAPPGSPSNMLCDICQLKVNVHRPYDNQELVSTGYIGDIDEDADDASKPDPPVIFGGDIHIEPWYFKTNTLLSLADPDTVSGDENTNWWNEDTDGDGRNLWQKKNDGEEYLDDLRVALFDKLKPTGKGDRKGLERAMREIIGDTSGIESLPIVWGLLWWEIVETRDHPWFRIEGEGGLETFKPASSDFIANPNLGDVPQEIDDNASSGEEKTYRTSKWVFQFFKESDNWFGYNEEYSKQNITDAAFPFRTNEENPTEFPTRVIRSATVQEGGERSAWRTFLQEDFVDLAQDRGRVVNIAPIGTNILIHTTEALFQTRADQRIKTTDQSAFVGSGDLFSPQPREIISLDEGYGGLVDHRAAQSYENGYVFIDKEAGKAFIFNGKQPQEISNKGMRKFFRDNLTPSSIPRVGYDPHTGRIFFSDKNSGWNYSFHPGLGAWVSNHSFQADYFFTTRDHLYTGIGDTIYRVSTGIPGNYQQTGEPFELEYIQSSPRPENQIVVSLVIDCRVLDSGVVVPKDTFDQFRIWNSYQDTNLTEIRPKTGENGSLKTNHNARLTDQAWKINEIRHDPSGPELSVDSQWKKKRRLADNFHRVKLVYDTDGRAIEVFSSALVTRASRR